MLTLRERLKKIRKRLKKYHKPVERISLSWLKIGDLVKLRSPYKPRSADEWVLDHGIEFWKDFPPPDIGGNHFGMRGDDMRNNLYDQICLIVDKRIYEYAIPNLQAETLIQIIVDEQIIWVRASALEKYHIKK